MDPITGLILSSLIGGGFSALAGSQQQPTFQPKDPFTGSLDNPEQMLSQFAKGSNDLITGLTGNLANGVSLPDAYVQTPGTMHVSGIPFPIGDTGHDPMQMMSLPGINQPKVAPTPQSRLAGQGTTSNGTPISDIPLQMGQEPARVARRKPKGAGADDSGDALAALRMLG